MWHTSMRIFLSMIIAELEGCRPRILTLLADELFRVRSELARATRHVQWPAPLARGRQCDKSLVSMLVRSSIGHLVSSVRTRITISVLYQITRGSLVSLSLHSRRNSHTHPSLALSFAFASPPRLLAPHTWQKSNNAVVPSAHQCRWARVGFSSHQGLFTP